MSGSRPNTEAAKAARRRYEVKREALAEELRVKLLALLGPVCLECGSPDKPEFDHPHGRDWEPNKMKRLARMVKYFEDFRKGNLRRLCQTCNRSDGGRRRWL